MYYNESIIIAAKILLIFLAAKNQGDFSPVLTSIMQPRDNIGDILMIRMWVILFITVSAIKWATVIVIHLISQKRFETLNQNFISLTGPRRPEGWRVL